MDTVINKWGNSLGMRVPQEITKQMGWRPGSPVHIYCDKNQLIVTPAKLHLDMLLLDVTPDNKPDSKDHFGTAAGLEEW